jgi:hypothetical protein
MPDLENRLRPVPRVKLIFAISLATRSRHIEAENLLENGVGPLELDSEIYCFSDFSKYYDSEFRGQTWKYFVAAKKCTSAERLVPIKLLAEKIQSSLALNNGEKRRTVNIDPGYINSWQLVLSTVKNQSHRLFMGSGVYAEVTLIYRDRSFTALPWTYPDYQYPSHLDYFETLRERYKEQCR